MNEPHDPNRTVEVPSTPDGNEPPGPGGTIDHSCASADSLDAGLAAGFGPPRSNLGNVPSVFLKEAEGESAHIVQPNSDAMPSPEQMGDRYQLFGEIARGGMGAVLRGRDVGLGRDLAVKVLLEKHADRPEVVRRFLEEAQVGAQLQHPGVVPVYDIGHFGERPFFTMKLIKGHTLTALLAERAELSADRPRFLAIALQVAQAVAYAHAKGVIHRDLKPANIMVGAFGEVQVMDWGLAKVLAEGGVADEERAGRQHQDEETQIRTARSNGSKDRFGTDTEAGSLLGTPAYMPPEQANGDIARLDRRCDVFGLGAILCEILTGKPPYVGRSPEEVRRKAANGDLADTLARLDGCEADAELITLAKTCLAPEAIDRPRNAQAVAESLSAYLDGVQERLQTAQRERAVALAREAEQRKRRKVQLALSAAVVALLLGGGAVAWWRNEQIHLVRQREVRNAEAVAALLSQTEEALKADDAAKARLALEAAKKRLTEGGAEKERERIERLDADLALLCELDAIDRFRWTVVENKSPSSAAVATRTQKGLTRFGADPNAMPVDDLAARVSTSVVRERIVAALDRLLRHEKTAGIRALLQRVDADSYRDAVRDAVVADDVKMMERLAGQKAALEQPAGFIAFLGENPAIPLKRRQQLLQKAVSQRPGNLALLMTLGETCLGQEKGSAKELLRWHQAAVAAAPANAAAHNNLAFALHLNRQEDEAIATLRQAIALDPKLAAAYCNLGNALMGKGKVDEAIACYHKAIALDPKGALAYSGLGLALHGKGQVDEAIACYHKAIALDPKYSTAHANLGAVLARQGRCDEAIARYREAIALDSKHAGFHANLGSALQARGQVDEAIAHWREVIALGPKFAQAHDNLASALQVRGQVDEAIAHWREAIALGPKLASAYFNLGRALKAKGQVDEAIACYRKTIALNPKDLEAHNNLGIALAGKGQLAEAITCFRKSVTLAPNLAVVHANLGLALAGQRQWDEAIACYRKAIALDPKNTSAHFHLGDTLQAKGRMNEAIACFRKVIELNPRIAQAHNNLGFALDATGKQKEAIEAWRTAVRLEPRMVKTHYWLGKALLLQDRPGEALVSLNEVAKRLPAAQVQALGLPAEIARAERLSRLEKRLPDILAGKDHLRDKRERLELSEMCRRQNRFAAAARLSAEVLAAEAKLADDLTAGHRYKAACCAARAAAGQGADAADLDEQERARLRKQALDWLRADLVLRTQQLASGEPAARAKVRGTMRYWQRDSDLAGIRDVMALAKLPAAERAAWGKLWADVTALLKKAETPVKKEDKR